MQDQVPNPEHDQPDAAGTTGVNSPAAAETDRQTAEADGNAREEAPPTTANADGATSPSGFRGWMRTWTRNAARGAAVPAGWHRRRIVAWVGVALLGLLAAWQLLPPRPDAQTPTAVDSVVVVGVGGLKWSDLDPDHTPNLWETSERSAAAALTTNSRRTLTCPLDGWLSFSAGAEAAGTQLGSGPECDPVTDEEIIVNGPDAMVGDQSDLVAENRDPENYVELGVLPTAVNCAVAVGPAAAYAAANAVGRVNHYYGQLPPASTLALDIEECALTMIDGGILPERGAARAAALAELDAMVGIAQEAAGENTALLVAGISQIGYPQHLLAMMLDLPDSDEPQQLMRPGGRPGYAHLTDLTPTLLAMLDAPGGETMTGQVLTTIPSPATETQGEALSRAQSQAEALAEADEHLVAAERASTFMQWLLVLALLVLMVVAYPLLRLLRKAGQPGVRPPPLWLMRANVVTALWCALLAPAAFLVDFFGWWNVAKPTWLALGLTILIAGVCTVAAIAAPKRRSPMGLMMTVSFFGLAVAIVAMLLTGRIHLGALIGDHSLSEAADVAAGPVLVGIVIGSLWLLAASAAWRLDVQLRAPVMAGIGIIGVILIGAHWLGDNIPAAVALIVGLCLAAALARGGWVSFGRVAWSIIAGLAALFLIIVLDVLREHTERGVLGNTAADLVVGETTLVVRGVAGTNMLTLFTSPLTVVTLVAGLYCWMVLLRPSGGLRRAFGLYPPLRAAFSAAVFSSLIAGIFMGKALMVLGSALAVMVPLAVIVSHRVLARAHVRDGEYNDMIVVAPSWVDEDLGGESVSVESRG
ncbi:hypothetical protein [Natronoglycomyces albus]|uniref:Uncharacterized protein n=1 Tax=Natronoglycomyces albus TaxID=2811108 RepID=A0A895XLT9_9ACTN|nr:hypothetical protein [Natronoglycomyces albus]QSB03915.1 hypothetical protein JQS30_08760 [Natronoglycomyces albus]